MTTFFLTAPAIDVPRRAMTEDELGNLARSRFGEDATNWAFQCPSCGDIATAADFPDGLGHRIGTECVGRHIRGRGCQRVATGPLPGPWLIKLSWGQVGGCFPLAPERPR